MNRDELAARAVKKRIQSTGLKQLQKEKNVTEYDNRCNEWYKNAKQIKL